MRVSWRAAGFITALAACSPPAGQPSGDAGGGVDGGGGGGGSDAGGGRTTLDCVGLVSCVTDCPDQDDACIEACGARATPAAISAFTALITCSNNRGCADEQCLAASCAAELNACRGGGGEVRDAGAPSDAGGGGGPGLTTSGRCEITIAPPGIPMQRTCWDYQLTVTQNHNDGTETFVYYDGTSASAGQRTCASSGGTFSTNQPGPWDSAAISMGNLANKRRACELANTGPSMAVFTEGASCERAGSRGYCAHQVTNEWNPSTEVLTGTVTTRWTVP